MKTTSAVENAHAIFGAHPEDVISPIKSAAETLGWLEEVFKTIEKEALEDRGGLRIKKLAALGAYVASDIGNYADCEYEKYQECLQKAGVINSLEVAA